LATFAVLKSRVSKTIGLDETDSSNDDVQLGYELNDAVRDFLLRTHANVNRSETTLDADTDDTEIPSSMLALLDLEVVGSDGSSRLPERTTPAEILRMRRAADSTGSSGTARFFALQGNNLLMFYPALASGDTIKTYYVPRPLEMDDDAHDPSSDSYGGIPVEYHPALIQYALWKMADYDDDGSSQMGVLYQQQYEKLVRDAKRWLRGKGGRSMGRAVVGRRPVLPVTPSQDVW
jgi:hypothetical protein